MAEAIETTDSGVARARTIFIDTRRQLDASIASVFKDAAAAGDALVACADEFGPGRATAAFDSNPALFGPVLADRPALPGLKALLDAVIDAHDALDQALAESDLTRCKSDPAALRRLHVNGRLFAIDPSRPDVRAIDGPDELLELRPPDLEPALAREMARQRDVDRLDRLRPRDQEPER